MVWGKTLPSGRERAIETLIDMEPQGSFYRATRVLVSPSYPLVGYSRKKISLGCNLMTISFAMTGRISATITLT